MAINHIYRFIKNPFWKYLGPEDILQAYCVSHILEDYPKLIWMHPPNEGKRTRFEQFKALVLGITPGIPDILIFKSCKGFNGLAIELKSEKGRSTANQKAMQEKLKECGWCVLEIRTENDFKEALKHYLK